MEKQFILDEIRRVAAENGGKAPGTIRFEKETGLPVRYAVGRFWARWSDAVREAGLEPNVLNTRFSDEDALSGVVRFIRELGRVPTKNELRLRRRTDNSIPSYDVFGTQRSLTSRLMAFCASSAELADVLAICQSLPTPPQAGEKVVDALVVGEVYLIKSGSFYKIGRSVSAGRRTRELQIQLPDKATRVHTILTDDPVGIERYWHERFADKRRNGEWFKLEAADVNAFRRRKFM